MQTSHWVLIACVVVFTALAAILDLRTKKLPNLLTVTAFATAILFHLCVGAVTGGWAGAGQRLLFSLGGFGTGFGILLVLWLIGSGGGGDVKYMGALGAWLGAVLTLQVFVVSAFLILIGACGVLVWEFFRLGFRRSREKYVESGSLQGGRNISEERRKTRRRLLPFGIPAALATWVVLCLDTIRNGAGVP